MAKVNQDKCIGCGTCASMCPEVFELNSDGKAVVKSGADLEKNKEKIAEVISSCPTKAISE